MCLYFRVEVKTSGAIMLVKILCVHLLIQVRDLLFSSPPHPLCVCVCMCVHGIATAAGPTRSPTQPLN
jgi:hypothetical protein